MQYVRTMEELAERIQQVAVRPGNRARLVAISGIDASGKGFIAGELARHMESQGVHVALLGLDGWLNLPPVRFSAHDPARHFYQHAFRFDQMFSTLIDPLIRDGRIDVSVDHAEETAIAYRKQQYSFHDVETVLLEGIFLFKRALQYRYDAKVWIDCSFETALKRALARGQEGLSPDATIEAFNRIYFPAERLHFDFDAPFEAADLHMCNDPLLAPEWFSPPPLVADSQL